MQPYVGWDLLFASVTCLQGYIKVDLFVLGARPLDTSLLGLCQHNKTLLPPKLPQCPVSQLEIPATFLGARCQDCRHGDLSPPLSPGCISHTTGRRSDQVSRDSLICRGIHPPSESGVKASDAHGTRWGAGTNLEALLIRLVRNPG
jgi:hypothetical protein